MGPYSWRPLISILHRTQCKPVQQFILSSCNTKINRLGVIQQNLELTRTMSSDSAQHPASSIHIFRSVADYRKWRNKAFARGQSVGFVPTMGALHDGHLSLVRHSLKQNDLTVVSIFVNPAQFAPHEDLATYPRTLPTDLALLEAEKFDLQSNGGETRTVSAVFVPTVNDMYPSGIVQNVTEQKGTFVEVKGYGHQMEGTSRPTFFRGVATVVTKLFNAIQPTNAYFGQKDIQQAFLLKRLSKDLLLAYPDPEHLHIISTARDPVDGLALSSRNAYLTVEGRQVAPTLRAAILAAEEAWNNGATKAEAIAKGVEVVESRKEKAQSDALNVNIKLDYLEMNDASTFEVLDPATRKVDTQLVILSGALYVDKTRLIDNSLLGDSNQVIG